MHACSLVFLGILMSCEFTYIDIPPTNERAQNSYSLISPATITTPGKASAEFSILLASIIPHLQQNEDQYLTTIKMMCPFLTVGDNSDSFLFNAAQQEAINSCDNLQTLFTKNLRGCWRWDDFSFLKYIIQVLEPSGPCAAMLNQYEQKLDSKMKLQQIYDQCVQEKQDVPDGYDKMVAIVRDKLFLHVTMLEYDQLKMFIAQNCGIQPHAILPSYKGAESSYNNSNLFSTGPTITAIDQEILQRQVRVKHNTFIQKLAMMLPHWQSTAKLLGLKDFDVQEIEADYPTGQREDGSFALIFRGEQAYQALRRWIESKGRSATYGDLLVALHDVALSNEHTTDAWWYAYQEIKSSAFSF